MVTLVTSTPSSSFFSFVSLLTKRSLLYFSNLLYFFVFPYAVDNCVSLSSKSSLALSFHFFLGLPLLLSPLTCPCSAAFGSFSFHPLHVFKPCTSSFILLYHRFLRSKFFSSCFLISYYLLSASTIDLSQPRHFCYLLSSSFLSVQHCDPYINTGSSTSVLCSFILVLSDMFFVIHIKVSRKLHMLTQFFFLYPPCILHLLLVFLQDIRTL